MSHEYKPYKNKAQDARYKIIPKKYPKVRALYGKIKSARKVAKIFGVDKKIILFIVNPEYKRRCEKKITENKKWLQYYNKDKHTLAVRKYRLKKRALGIGKKRKQKKVNKPKICVICKKNLV